MAEKYYMNAEGLEATRENPFLVALLKDELGTKTQLVKGKGGWASKAAHLLDPETGELLGDDTLCLAYKVAVDRQKFVKVFVSGLQAAFDLSKKARTAFTVMLQRYSDNSSCRPGDRNDMVIFSLADAEAGGWKVSRSTFRSAMNELCHKKFLCPVSGASDWYWTNPTFFHKGDRLVMVNHYVTGDEAKKKPALQVNNGGDPDLDQLDFNGETVRDKLKRGKS